MSPSCCSHPVRRSGRTRLVGVAFASAPISHLRAASSFISILKPDNLAAALGSLAPPTAKLLLARVAIGPENKAPSSDSDPDPKRGDSRSDSGGRKAYILHRQLLPYSTERLQVSRVKFEQVPAKAPIRRLPASSARIKCHLAPEMEFRLRSVNFFKHSHGSAHQSCSGLAKVSRATRLSFYKIQRFRPLMGSFGGSNAPQRAMRKVLFALWL